MVECKLIDSIKDVNEVDYISVIMGILTSMCKVFKYKKEKKTELYYKLLNIVNQSLKKNHVFHPKKDRIKYDNGYKIDMVIKTYYHPTLIFKVPKAGDYIERIDAYNMPFNLRAKKNGLILFQSTGVLVLREAMPYYMIEEFLCIEFMVSVPTKLTISYKDRVKKRRRHSSKKEKIIYHSISYKIDAGQIELV